MSKLTDGNSLLKNLGFSSESDSGEDPFQVNVRPKYAGVSEEFSKPKEVIPELLQPRGVWRKKSKHVELELPKGHIGNENGFTTTQICTDFQQSLMKYEQNAHVQSRYRTNTAFEAENSKERIVILKNQIKNFSRRLENEQTLRKVIDRMDANNFDYNSAIKICIILSQDPTIINQEETKKLKFSSKKSEIDPKSIAFTVVSHYTKKLLKDIKNIHQEEWKQAKEWILSVSQALNKQGLWEDFLTQKIFPHFEILINKGEKHEEITNFIKRIYKLGILSVQNVILFFSESARPYLIRNLSKMTSQDTMLWVDLAASIGIPDHFSNIVKEHASYLLKKWKPGDNTASTLISHWPHVLGSSLDFFYKTISPKLIPFLEEGKIEVLTPWIPVFPENLTTSLVADCFIRSEGKKILKNQNPKSAAQQYLALKSKIPKEIKNNQKILESLLIILDNLKMRNHITSGIKLRDIKQVTAEDLLKNIAAQNGKTFKRVDKGSSTPTFEINDITIVLKSGVLHVLNPSTNNLDPIFVSDLISLIQK